MSKRYHDVMIKEFRSRDLNRKIDLLSEELRRFWEYTAEASEPKFIEEEANELFPIILECLVELKVEED